MSKLVQTPLLFAPILLLGSITSLADTSITGYASIIAGKVLDGDAFLADYPKTGIYDDDISFSPDTSFGLQYSNDINDTTSLTIQVTAHGAQEYDPKISWAYVNYRFTPEFSVQLGRKRLPLYYYSDFFDLGFAYYWIRPPADNYTWQITNYNGLSLLYETNINNWDLLVNAYIGREDSDDNELLSLLYNADVDETWKNMVGFVTEASLSWIEFRLSMLESQVDRTVDGVTDISNAGQSFRGLSLNLYPGNFTILSEYNKFGQDFNDIDIHTYMISLGYSIGDFTPHITYSKFKQDPNINNGDEEHSTSSVGLRWSINAKTAFKTQYDVVSDQGVNTPIMGDSRTVSFGIDMVF